GRESQLRAEAADDGLQHFAIRMEGALLGEFLEIAIEFQKRGVFQCVAVGCQDAVKGGENAGFPVNQRSIAIEGKNFEAVEVEHGALVLISPRMFQTKQKTSPRSGSGG